MTIVVNLPDGSQAQFPDGTSDQAMQSAISKQFPPTDPQAAAQAQADQASSQSSNAFMAGVDSFNRQFEKVALGSEQLISNLIPSSLGGQRIRDAINQVNQQGSPSGVVIGATQAQQDATNYPTASSLGSLAGMVGVGSVGGGLAAGKIAPSVLGDVAARTLGGAVTGAGYGLVAEPTDTFANKLIDIGTGAVAGGLLANVLPMAQGILNLGKNIKNAAFGEQNYKSNMLTRVFNPSQAALQDRAFQLSSDINPSDLAADPQQAANSYLDSSLSDFKKLGMNATPGQATGDLEVRGNEYATPVGMLDKANVKAFNQQQQQTLQNNLINTINDMSPDGTKALRDQLYQSFSDKELPPATVSDIVTNNPPVQQILGQLNDTNLPIAQLPIQNAAKLDYVKQVIDNQLWNDSRVFDPANKMSNIVRDSLLQSRNSIVNALDDALPDVYPAARQAAEKVAIQNNYLNLLQNVRNPVGTSLQLPEDLSTKLTPDQLNALGNLQKVNATLFGTDNKITTFLNDVQKTGGNVDYARSIINVSNKLAGTSLEQLVKRSPQSLSQFIATGESAGLLNRFVNHLLSGGYNKALLNLTLSGQWDSDIKNEIIKQASTPSKQVLGFMKLVNKVSTTGKNLISSQPAVNTTTLGAINSASPQTTNSSNNSLYLGDDSGQTGYLGQ